jgi:hypothetical protein
VRYRTARIKVFVVSWIAMSRNSQLKSPSTRVLDYSETMSQYERESLAAEATLKAEKKLKNGRQTTNRQKKHQSDGRS